MSIEQILQDNTAALREVNASLLKVADLLYQNSSIGAKGNQIAKVLLERQQVAAQTALGSSFDVNLVREALEVGQHYASQCHEPGNDEADLILISKAIDSVGPGKEITHAPSKCEPVSFKEAIDAERKETEQAEERAADKAIEDAKIAPAKPSEIYQEVFKHATKPEEAATAIEHPAAVREAPTYTIDDVKARIMTLMTGGHRDKAATVLKDHGANKMSEVKPEDYAAVVVALDAVIAVVNEKA